MIVQIKKITDTLLFLQPLQSVNKYYRQYRKTSAKPEATYQILQNEAASYARDLFEEFLDKVQIMEDSGHSVPTIKAAFDVIRNGYRLNEFTVFMDPYFQKGWTDANLVTGGHAGDYVKNPLLITSYFLKGGARSFEHFNRIVLEITHEYVYGWFKDNLRIDDHEASEVVAYFFTLCPNEFVSWRNENFPDTKKITSIFVEEHDITIQDRRIKKFYEYYNRLTNKQQLILSSTNKCNTLG